MAIRVRCPRCWETAEVPEDARGKQGKCNSCGAMVTIPTKVTKACFICGTDVTHVKHAKDLDNNYLCQSCWEARNESQRAVFSLPSLECAVCYARIAPGEGFEVNGQPVCKDCHVRKLSPAPAVLTTPAASVPAPSAPASPAGSTAPTAPPQPVSPPKAPTGNGHPLEDVHDHGHHGEADHVDLHDREHLVADALAAMSAGQRQPTRIITRASSPAALAIACLALAGCAVLAFFQFGRKSWEESNRDRILVIEAQAEVLVSVGRTRDGLEKYNELMRLVNGKVIRDDLLKHEVEAAQAAIKRAADQPDAFDEEQRTQAALAKAQADVRQMRFELEQAKQLLAALQQASNISRVAVRPPDPPVHLDPPPSTRISEPPVAIRQPPATMPIAQETSQQPQTQQIVAEPVKPPLKSIFDEP